MGVGIDMKDRQKNWWHEKMVSEVTWNHLILAAIGIALIIAYVSLDWDRVFGLG